MSIYVIVVQGQLTDRITCIPIPEIRYDPVRDVFREFPGPGKNSVPRKKINPGFSGDIPRLRDL